MPAPLLAQAFALVAAMAPGTAFRDCAVCPEMVVLPAGSFEMGSPASEPGRYQDEGPQHRVAFAHQFAVAKGPVNRGEFARFVRATGYRAGPGCLIVQGGTWVDARNADWRHPGFAQTELDPAVCMSWNDGEAYANWLSGKTGHRYALLTEAQWEYAARAGARTAYSWGAQARRDRANYGAKACCAPEARGADRWLATSPSGSFPPNAFGLYDMHGNVWEWVQDCWHRNYEGAPNDGSAWTTGSCVDRVMRGGSWNCSPATIRAAEREVHDLSGRYAVVGFRVARTD